MKTSTLCALTFQQLFVYFSTTFQQLFNNCSTTFWQLFDNFWQLFDNLFTTFCQHFDNTKLYTNNINIQAILLPKKSEKAANAQDIPLKPTGPFKGHHKYSNQISPPSRRKPVDGWWLASELAPVLAGRHIPNGPYQGRQNNQKSINTF